MTLYIVELELSIDHKPASEDAPGKVTHHTLTRIISAADPLAAGEIALRDEVAALREDNPLDSYATAWDMQVRKAREAAQA